MQYKGFEVPAGTDPANVPQAFRNYVDSVGSSFISTNAADIAGVPDNYAVNIQGATMIRIGGFWQYLGTPPGSLQIFGGPTIPTGWLLCNGQAISRSTYPLLFGQIGTAYGAGNGTTTFNAPDMRNRVAVGSGSSYALSTAGGAASHTISEAQMPSHTHPISNDGWHAHTIGGGFLAGGGSGGLGIVSSGFQVQNFSATDSTGTHAHGGATSARGGGQPINIMQPYVAMNYIIKT